MGELHAGNAARYKEIFSPDYFRYEEKEDIYYCPVGETLHPRRYHKRRNVTEYLTRKGTCDACILRNQCTHAKHGRSIARHFEHELVEQGRKQSRTPEARKDLARRKHLIEGSFADAKRHHFKRSRWRRLHRQRMQDYLIAVVQNIKIIIKNYKKTPKVPVALELISLSIRILAPNQLLCAANRYLIRPEGIS